MDQLSVSSASDIRDAILSHLSQWESVSLLNRLNQSVEIQLQCRLYKGRFHVFIRSESLGESRRLEKSAEYIAQQLVERLGVKPEAVSFVLSQVGEPRGCWRWSFQWVGNAPLKSVFAALGDGAQERLLSQVVGKGAIYSVAQGQITQVA